MEDMELKEERYYEYMKIAAKDITALVFTTSYYGRLRESYAIGKKRVERLMQEMDIQVITNLQQKTISIAISHPINQILLGGRYYLHLYTKGLALSCYYCGSLLP